MIALVIVALAAPGLTRLQLRTDGHALLPLHDPGILIDDQVRSTFHLRDQIVVLITASDADGIFNTRTLSLIRNVTDRLIALPDIDSSHVTSLSTEKNDRVMPGTLNFQTFLAEIPQSPEAIARLRDDLRKLDIYRGTLISHDEKAACVLVGVRVGQNRQAMYHAVRKLASEMTPAPDRIDVVGAPVAESLLGTHILEDLGVPSAWMGGWDPTEPPMTGLPRSLFDLRRWIAGNIGLVPIAVATMALVFLARFRNPIAAAIPLMEAGSCLVFTFGLMGWSGVPVYLTIAVLPIILCAAGITDEIHIFSRYRQLAAEMPNADGRGLIAATVNDLWRPIVKTSMTTAVAFCSFALSDLKPVQAFGVFCAIGILFCLAWSLTVAPAMLALIPRGRLVRPRLLSMEDRVPPPNGSRPAAVAQWIIGRRSIILLSAAALLVATPWGIAKLRVQDSWIDGFSPHSEFRRATEAVNRGFFGAHVLALEIASPDWQIHGDLDPEAVGMFDFSVPIDAVCSETDISPGNWVGAFARIEVSIDREASSARATSSSLISPRSATINLPSRFVRLVEIESVEQQAGQVLVRTKREGGPLNFHPGGSDPIHMSYTISPRRMYRPETLELIRQLDESIRARHEDAVGGVLGPYEYLAALNYSALARRDDERRIPPNAQRLTWLWEQYERLRGAEKLSQIVTRDGSRCLVTIFLNDANYHRTARLMEHIRDFEREHLSPQQLKIEFAGDVAASQTLIQSIVRTQVRSVIGSLAGILIVTILLNRSIRWGLLAIIPCSLAVVANFAVMGWLNIPIGVATSMFAAMTLGIGVDHGIHLIDRFRSLGASGSRPREAAVQSISTTGPAIVTDAMAICLGFSVMLLSQIPSNARLGILLICCDIACVGSAFLLLPGLMTLQRDRPDERPLKVES
ncbi:MAG: MMPL family transporter [Phycisphaerae bacterium]|nr:MMPL family transporter [Phycisphaerae bacterium]